ncbi:uncharacterized protein LOC112520235 [Cynara cardunculus var. scolymus]|uniref:uncharacterized protein LOC112520235 n=1 Tax=Cynara cardunculus var. scolymus TaxID=59895 RepID=UPI000D62EB5C|nr:uncharacterized protein LOC112520235 [Cynara cardunculus var. scolymus]
MLSVASWNTRGLCNLSHQRAVRDLIRESNLHVCAALESRASVSSLPSICERVFGSWSWASNGSLCLRGTRIIVAWNPVHVDMMLLNATDQVMHFQVKIRDSSKILFLSMVYAENYHIARRQLWASLKGHKHVVKDTPWFIMGDFNVALDPKDNSSGTSGPNRGMDDFRQCVRHLEVEDVNYKGLFFTWTKNPNGTGGLLKKINRILGNSHSLARFPSASVVFLPYRNLDHSPAVLTLPSGSPRKPKPFKFPNLLTYKEPFLNVVSSHWHPDLVGREMYKISQNLKNLKGPLRKMLSDQGNLHSKVAKLRLELDRVQIALDRDPENGALREEHCGYLSTYNSACLDEERFLMQKAKINWLHEGDRNSSFFHKSDWRLEKKSSDVFVPDNNIKDDARSSRFSSTSDTNVDEEAPLMASSRLSYIGRSQLSSRDA